MALNVHNQEIVSSPFHCFVKYVQIYSFIRHVKELIDLSG